VHEDRWIWMKNAKGEVMRFDSIERLAREAQGWTHVKNGKGDPIEAPPKPAPAAPVKPPVAPLKPAGAAVAPKHTAAPAPESGKAV